MPYFVSSMSPLELALARRYVARRAAEQAAEQAAVPPATAGREPFVRARPRDDLAAAAMRAQLLMRKRKRGSMPEPPSFLPEPQPLRYAYAPYAAYEPY